MVAWRQLGVNGGCYVGIELVHGDLLERNLPDDGLVLKARNAHAVVDREADEPGQAGHLGDREVGPPAMPAHRSRGMNQRLAPGALPEPKAAVVPARPEELVGDRQLGQDPHELRAHIGRFRTTLSVLRHRPTRLPRAILLWLFQSLSPMSLCRCRPPKARGAAFSSDSRMTGQYTTGAGLGRVAPGHATNPSH